MLGCSLDDGRDLLARYFATYPGVKRYLDSAAAESMHSGYSRTIGGRRRNFRLPLKPERRQFVSWNGYMAAIEAYRIEESKVRRQAANAGIQGTAADILKLALVLTQRRLPEGAYLVAAVHDELIVEAAESCADEAASVLAHGMEQSARAYLPSVALGDFTVTRASYWRKS